MKRSKFAFVTACALLLALPAFVFAAGKKDQGGSSSAPAAAPAAKIAISHNSSLESPWQKASLAFADIVNKETGGRYKAEVFGNGVLFQRNWKVMLEMTQSGSSQIGIESVTALAAIVPELSAMSLPFLFNDLDHVIRFLNSGNPVWEKWITDGFAKQNLVVLSISPRPFRQINNNKRIIKTPADIKDLKFRVPATPFFVSVFENLGAKPVPLPSGEIYTAIQLGTVVGEDNSIPVQYDFKTHEVAKNFTIWNYIADASVMFINKDIWDKMSDADKAVYKKAAKVWADVNVKEDSDYTVVALEKMKAAGVNFYTMTEAEKEPFKKILQPVYDNMAKQVGDANFQALMDGVKKTAAK
jgi:TRAP-type C4-dicarboxylate transport system substrate-binding protein